MKGIRIAVLTSAFAVALAALQFSYRPIHAAQQSASAETSPPAKAGAPETPGAASYAKHCAVCHGPQREGILPGFPPLLGIGHRMSNDQIAQVIHAGKGRMPGFPSLKENELGDLVHYLDSSPAQAESGNAAPGNGASGNSSEPAGAVAAGDALFHQNCAFCHGRDAMGGETGPDLTQSKIVLSDKSGDKIAAVVREGRPDNKMPSFNFSSQEMATLVAFIRARVTAAESHKGGRRGVSVDDLKTGNADAGKAYFNGAGECSKCHSPSGDLAGIASRIQGLELEEQMLFPRGAKSRVTVTTPAGETISGTLAYRDEFTIALRDANGVYRSWQAPGVKFTIDSPVDAHAAQFEKYSDADVHNLMAYLETLR